MSPSRTREAGIEMGNRDRRFLPPSRGPRPSDGPDLAMLETRGGAAAVRCVEGSDGRGAAMSRGGHPIAAVHEAPSSGFLAIGEMAPQR